VLIFSSSNNSKMGDGLTNENETSVYVTAIVMQALRHYRHIPTLNIIPALDKAQAYLLDELNQFDNETFAVALALIAILPRLSNQDDIASHLETLRTAQLVKAVGKMMFALSQSGKNNKKKQTQFKTLSAFLLNSPRFSKPRKSLP
jgi:hypothetical protein